MKFKTLDVIAIAQYAPVPSNFHAVEHVWYNINDIIDVDFDIVVESLFIKDYSKNKFTPVDLAAQNWVELTFRD